MTTAYDERASAFNQEFVARMRAESCLDNSVRLAPGANMARPIFGPSQRKHFSEKHARGEYGAYFLHQGDDSR